MARTHSISTNRYGVNSFVVSTSAANGDYTTLAAAMADAVSGDTIFLRDSVTENVTITPGVNIAAWSGGTLNVPSITGTLTMSGAGTSTLSGLRLVTNSAALIAVTGSAASILNVFNCFLNCADNTGITYSTSSSGSGINIFNCRGNIGTTGISLFSHSSAGQLDIRNSFFANTGSSTTASTCSAGSINSSFSTFQFPITWSGTGGGTFQFSSLSNSGLNTTMLTAGGSGSQGLKFCRVESGTASAISISTTLDVEDLIVSSSNTNAITGAGTIIGNTINFTGSSSLVNTTTQTPYVYGLENSWTPNIQINSSSTGITYTTQLGGYCVLGKVVFIWAQVLLSSKGASVGNVTISNLPISPTANGASKCLPCSEYNQVTKAGYTSLGLRLANSAVGTFILSSASGSAVSFMTQAEISDTFAFRFSSLYIID